MKKMIIGKIIDVGFLVVLYAAFAKNQQWAYNLIIPVAVITLTLALLIPLLLSNDEFKQKIKATHKPRGDLAKWYSLTYDISVTLILCAFGYAVTGVLWFFITILTWSSLNSLDSEIKNGETK